MRTTAARSHAMLLLLPPTLIKSSASMQSYIVDHQG
jgi:hypothetical protein